MMFNKYYLLLLLLAGSACVLYGATDGVKKTVTISVAGVAEWDELVSRQQISIQSSVPETQRAIPFMKGPPVKSIESNVPVNNNGIYSPLQEITPPDTSPSPLGPVFGVNFQALGDNNTTIPPDTMGAVGPRHIMTMLNSQVRIQDKTGSTISTVSSSTFWTSGTGLSGSPFDPIVFFDADSQRWIATCDANSRSANSKLFLAVSVTSDPTGTWTYYSLAADPSGAEWADFPGMGINQKWIALTENMFTVASNNFSGVKMWVIDKSTALSGGSLTVTVFATGFDNSGGTSGFTLKPCLTFGTETNLYIIDNGGYLSGGTALLRMSQITGTASSPSWSVTPGSSFSNSGLFFVNNNFNNTQIDAAQKGSATRIRTDDARMQNTIFRNGKIWCVHSGGLPASSTADRTAVFWYELSPSQMVSSGAPIVQSGVLDGGTGTHYFFPSIAVNSSEDVCIGCSRSDSSRYVEAVATGRNFGDSSGTLDPVSVIKAGEDIYVKDFGSGSVRWGDYSATCVDPTDDHTFWSLQEYAALDVGANPNDDRWGTWWGQFGGTPPSFWSVTASPTPATTGVTVTVTFTASEQLLANPVVTVNSHACTYSNSSGQNYTYMYTVQATDSDGPAAINITGIDLAGTMGSSLDSSALIVDKTPPICVISRMDANPTTNDTVHFDIHFTESVTNFIQPDVTLSGTAPGKSITGFSGATSNYYVTVGNIIGTGTVTLNVDADKCTDYAGNGNLASDFVSYTIGSSNKNLTVVSQYGMATPPVGTNSFSSGTNIVCAITNSPIVIEESNSWKSCICTGWIGSGSVPVSGNTTNTGSFAINADSSITWLWAVSNVVFSNQTVVITQTNSAMESIEAGHGYEIKSPGNVLFEAGKTIKLTPDFHVGTGAVFRARIIP